MAAAELAAAKRSDLPVRVASAVVMVAVAGLAFWLRGLVLTGFVLAIVLGVLSEWIRLVFAFESRLVLRLVWLLAGVFYLGIAGYSALFALAPMQLIFPVRIEFWPLLTVVAAVIGVDVGAYFAGRTFKGPKIAPMISPSKTWSGLVGAIIGAAAMVWLLSFNPPGQAVVTGLLIAIVAQAGDFFESWMKRRAGVKDSGSLIPGHGGLFDRADGLIAVLFVIGVFSLVSEGLGARSTPLPFRGGAGGPHGTALGDGPHPNPSPEGEGLARVSRVHRGLFVVRIAR